MESYSAGKQDKLQLSINTYSTQGEIVVHGGLADSWQWDLTVQVNKIISNSLSTTVSPWQWNLTAQVNQMDKIISNSVSTRIFYLKRDTNTE